MPQEPSVADELVVYCGSGVSAFINIFALEPAGVWEKALSRFVGRLVEPRRSGRAWLILK